MNWVQQYTFQYRGKESFLLRKLYRRGDRVYRFYGSQLNTTLVPSVDTRSWDQVKSEKNFLLLLLVEEVAYSTDLVKQATEYYITRGIWAFRLVAGFGTFALAAATLTVILRLVESEVLEPVINLQNHIINPPRSRYQLRQYVLRMQQQLEAERGKRVESIEKNEVNMLLFTFASFFTGQSGKLVNDDIVNFHEPEEGLNGLSPVHQLCLQQVQIPATIQRLFINNNFFPRLGDFDESEAPGEAEAMDGT